MDAREILAAWNAAAASGRFYEEFQKATGFDEATVKRLFSEWNGLTHAAAEEVASENGVTVREAGFQAYLADVKRIGRPRMVAITGVASDLDDDPNPRRDRPWPASEDCPGCDGRLGPEGKHRFRCDYGGSQQVVLPVTVSSEGKVRVDVPLPKQSSPTLVPGLFDMTTEELVRRLYTGGPFPEWRTYEGVSLRDMDVDRRATHDAGLVEYIVRAMEEEASVFVHISRDLSLCSRTLQSVCGGDAEPVRVGEWVHAMGARNMNAQHAARAKLAFLKS